MNDYKKILSRFLSSSLSCTNQNIQGSTQVDLGSNKSKSSIVSKKSSSAYNPDSAREVAKSKISEGRPESRLQTICEKLNIQRDLSKGSLKDKIKTPQNQYKS